MDHGGAMNGRGHHLMLRGAVRNENCYPQAVTRRSANRTVNLQVDGVVMAVMIVSATTVPVTIVIAMIACAKTVSVMGVQVI